MREKIIALSATIKGRTDIKVDGKNALLQEELQKDGSPHQMIVLDQQCLPHEPLTRVVGVVPNECIVFKSHVQPMRLSFNVRKFGKDFK